MIRSAIAIALLGACSTAHQDLGHNRRDGSEPIALVALAAGDSHTCGIDATGAVWCWGSDRSGQLGVDPGAVETCSGVPCTLRPIRSTLGPAASIAAGGDVTCVLTSDLTRVQCVGLDGIGQLARGTIDNDPHPSPITIDVQEVLHVSVGRFHSCVVRVGGSIACWGLARDGQTGPGATESCVVEEPTASAIGVAPGTSLACATSPLEFPPMADAVAISAGEHHTCIARGNGQAHCFGLGTLGQLGNGAALSSSTPVEVAGLAGVTDINVGGVHSCAIGTAQSLHCWGGNGTGQLGVGAAVDTMCGSMAEPCTSLAVPVPIPSASPAVAHLVAGDAHVCAVTVGGELYCWGNAQNGQLGIGAVTSCDARTGAICRAMPVRVDGAFSAVAAGRSHVCAIRQNGSVACWGANTMGQLGVGNTTDVAIPTDLVW